MGVRVHQPRGERAAGECRDGEQRPDEQTGEQLASDYSTDGNTDGQTADHQRLGLRAHGVGHVDHGGDEDGQQHVGLQALLEGADQQRGDHRRQFQNEHYGGKYRNTEFLGMGILPDH